MKIVTRTYTSVSPLNGATDCSGARNRKNAAAVNMQPVPTRLPIEQETGGMMSSGGLRAGLHESPRREFVPVAAGRSEAASGLPGRTVTENEIIFLYCVKGRGWCEIEGKRYELMPGQLLVTPARLERRYAMYGERVWSVIWMQLAETNRGAFSKKSNVMLQAATPGLQEKTQILALFQDVLCELEMPCQRRLQQVSQTVINLLDHTMSDRHESGFTETTTAGRISRTIEYMKEHLNEPLRAAALAAVANMSLPHYFAQFKRVVGSSPIDYLIKLRMEHARRLLSETSWSVKEVAVSLGYDDPLYFSRVFKSVNQTAPSDFRAKTRVVNGG